jgi:hypothetical protein
VVDDGILAGLQNEADVQGRDKQLSLDIGRVIGEQRRQCLEDLELDIEAGRRGLLQGLEDLAQPGPRERPGYYKPLQADDGDAGKLDILGAAGDDERVDEVGALGQF